jgi:cytochrome c biogenesis protein CcmG, thiol:disulfide interchange protein DsbE
VSRNAPESCIDHATGPKTSPSPRRGHAWRARAGVVLPVLVVLALLAAAFLRHQQTLAIGAALARGETPRVPDLMLPAFDGSPVALRGFAGHPVILNFGASWCIPCRDEAPLLERTWREFRGQGLVVLGVDTQDLETPARAFLKEFRITYSNVRDPDGSVARQFGTTGVPETFFIDRDGRIRGKFPGMEARPDAWRAAALGLLSGQAHVP